MGEVEDINKDYEPNPERISQAIENVGIAPGFPETGNRTRDKLNNHTDWEEWKASEFYQLDAMDKDNMFGTTCIIPHRDIVLRQIWTYVIRQSGKGSQ